MYVYLSTALDISKKFYFLFIAVLQFKQFFNEKQTNKNYNNDKKQQTANTNVSKQSGRIQGKQSKGLQDPEGSSVLCREWRLHEVIWALKRS